MFAFKPRPEPKSLVVQAVPASVLMNTPFKRHQQRRRGTLFPGVTVVLFALMLLPTLASVRLSRSFDPRFLAGYFVCISAATFWLYWHDKRRAEGNGWRTPESTLHLAELFGGWPAAFLAQRTLRHKSAKSSYQATFWAIIALHQAACFDFLHDWHYSRSALLLLSP